MTNLKGRFGIHGGQYIPKTLMNATIRPEATYGHYKKDCAARVRYRGADISE